MLEIHRRANRLSTTPGQVGHTGERILPRTRDQRGDVLHLEEEVCQPRRAKTAQTRAAQAGERTPGASRG